MKTNHKSKINWGESQCFENQPKHIGRATCVFHKRGNNEKIILGTKDILY